MQRPKTIQPPICSIHVRHLSIRRKFKLRNAHNRTRPASHHRPIRTLLLPSRAYNATPLAGAITISNLEGIFGCFMVQNLGVCRCYGITGYFIVWLYAVLCDPFVVMTISLRMERSLFLHNGIFEGFLLCTFRIPYEDIMEASVFYLRVMIFIKKYEGLLSYEKSGFLFSSLCFSTHLRYSFSLYVFKNSCRRRYVLKESRKRMLDIDISIYIINI